MGASRIHTLAQLAHRAGLSRSAVSRALRNDPNQSPATRLRVQQLARELGYHPDPRVAALMAQVRRGRVRRGDETIALLNTWRDPARFPSMDLLPPWLEGCKAAAIGHGYRMQMFELHSPGMTPRRLREILVARGVVGLIVMPYEEPDATLPLPLDGWACATTGYSLRQPNIHRAARDFAYDLMIAADAVLRLGYRRPGLVVPDSVEYRNAHHWTASFMTVQHRLPFEDRLPVLLTPGEINAPECFAANASAFGAWWRQHRPDVVFSYHDFVPAALRHLGKSKSACTAYVDLMLRIAGGGQAGMHLPWEKIGEATVELTVDQLNRHESGVPLVAKRTLLHGEWNQGELGPPRTRRSP